MLVMGPWTHGGWAIPDYNDPSRIPFREEDKYFFLNEIEYPFFTHFPQRKRKSESTGCLGV
jgi:predicted acyl esterase